MRGDKRQPERHRERDRTLEEVAVLGDAVRRELYEFVAARPGGATRDDAASGVSVARHVAKFHLDKLVAAGLLDVDFRRPPGAGGPGAGRPAKWYRRADREVAITLPARRYDLAAQLLANAIADAAEGGIAVADAVAATATAAGKALGERARHRAAGHRTTTSAVRNVVAVLDEAGYEPSRDRAGIVLSNCPFHAIADQHPELVCGMNLDFVRGIVDGLGAADLEARLDPQPGRCCVRLAAAATRRSRSATPAAAPARRRRGDQ